VVIRALERLEDRTLLSAGGLDTSFGVNGIVTTDFGQPATANVTALAVQSTGAIVTLGNTGDSGFPGPAGESVFDLARFDAQGNLDTTFGAPDPAQPGSRTGRVITAFSARAIPDALAILPDDRILAAGSSLYHGIIDLAQYLPNGDPDPSFGVGGKVEYELPSVRLGHNTFDITGVALQPFDGTTRIVVTGTSLGEKLIMVRFNADGTLDDGSSSDSTPGDAFGTGGIVNTGLALSGRVVVQPGDGKLVFYGGFLARFNPDGSPDTSFGLNHNGIVNISFPGSLQAITSLALQGDKILLGGAEEIPNAPGSATGASDFLMLRYNSDGTADTSFGAGGQVTTDIASGSSDMIEDLLVEGDAIVAVGRSAATTLLPQDIGFPNPVPCTVALARYSANGQLDASFGLDGIATTSLSAPYFPGDPFTLQGDAYVIANGFQLARVTSTGAQDLGFGSGGLALTEFASGTYEDPNARVALQPDGKIVVAGTGGTLDSDYPDFILARYNPDGSLDTTFGNGGKVVTDPGDAQAQASIAGVAIEYDPNNPSLFKIVIAASITDWPTQTPYIVIERYNSDGSLDTTFNGTGSERLTIGLAAWASGIAIQPGDDKIVVAGSTYRDDLGVNVPLLVRFDVDGSLDTSFNHTGEVATDVGSPDAGVDSLVVQPDGKIVAAGWSLQDSTSYDFLLMRFNSDGSPDLGFGSSGLTTTDFGSGGIDSAYSVALDASGRIIAAGGASGVFGIARYDANGNLDTSHFGTGGLVTVDFTAVSTLDRGSLPLAAADGPLYREQWANRVVVQSDGKIVVAGASYLEGPDDFIYPTGLNLGIGEFALVRLDDQGIPDPGFGTDGLVTTNLGSSVTYLDLIDGNFFTNPGGAFDVALQPDGKMVVAGGAYRVATGSDIGLARYDGGPLNIVSQNQVSSALSNLISTANLSGRPVEVTLRVTTTDPSQAAAQVGEVFAALATAPASTGVMTRVTLDLGGATISSSTPISVPQGVALVLKTNAGATIQGATVDAGTITVTAGVAPVNWTVNGGSVYVQGSASAGDFVVNGGTVTLADGTVITGHSSAIIVNGGTVILQGVTAQTATNAPTIVVNGGSLTVRNSTIQESTGYDQAAILVTGGFLDLGTSSDPGGNLLNINGAGEFVHAATSTSVAAVGNTYTTNRAAPGTHALGFTVVASSASSSIIGQPVTFTATVSAANPADGTPAGSVDFFDTTTNNDLGTATLTGGVARLTTATLTVGSHAISARYAGSSMFTLSRDALIQTVLYHFGGFLAPLSTGVSYALGRTIPVKFSLTNYGGSAVTSLAAVTSLRVAPVNSDGSLGTPFTPASSDGKGLTYSGGQFQFNWQTKGLPPAQYQIRLSLADGTAQTKTISLSANGSSAGLMADGTAAGQATAGALQGGDVALYVDNSSGLLTTDELARIDDAVAAVDAALAPYGVTVSETTDSTSANVVLDTNTTTAVGSAADGVLGCETPSNDSTEITLVQGWNWYAGADPTAIQAGQFDFETVVMHELGHALGLGHSADPTSVMYATLAPGMANRNLTVADLNVPDGDGGGSSGLHARVFHSALPPAAAAAPPTLNQNFGLMAWDLAVADLSWTGLARTQRKRT
jgi:uncharacterized delta-60 repeat protein